MIIFMDRFDIINNEWPANLAQILRALTTEQLIALHSR